MAGNLIGTDITGSARLGNGGSGMRTVFASRVTIGGTISGAGNVVSGNLIGVFLDGAGSTDNVVQGNLIGTDVTGTIGSGNTLDGLELSNVARTTVGGRLPRRGTSSREMALTASSSAELLPRTISSWVIGSAPIDRGLFH